jgi:hypothetical protein
MGCPTLVLKDPDALRSWRTLDQPLAKVADGLVRTNDCGGRRVNLDA